MNEVVGVCYAKIGGPERRQDRRGDNVSWLRGSFVVAKASSSAAIDKKQHLHLVFSPSV